MGQGVASEFQSERTSSLGDGRVAIFFVSHTLDESVLDRFEDLQTDARPDDDVYFAYDATDATDSEYSRAREIAGDKLLAFQESAVLDTDYPNPWADPERKGIVPGNLDLLWLGLSRTVPEYDRYWYIEYDVVYTGAWTDIFEAPTSSADVIGTTLHPFDHNPDWYWWPYFDPPPDVDQSAWRRGFFPVAGLSPNALSALDEGYKVGWSGHTEAVVPTLAHWRDLELEDLGGNGPYVKDGNRERFYTNTPENGSLAPGTFIYRPPRSRPGSRSQTLWHPIKPDLE